VDTATSRVPPTGTPVMAGAAANVSDPRLSTDGAAPGSPGSPFGVVDDHLEPRFGGSYDDHGQPSMTAPQPMVAVDDLDPAAMPLAMASGNGTGPAAIRSRGGHRAQPRRARRSGRRRWPIVTTSLVVLLAVVVVGGYVGWRWTQEQYYVGADKGEVVIFRGLNERIAWWNLSKPYKQTGIRLNQVPANDEQTVRTDYASGSLPQVQKTVSNIQDAVTQCQQQYAKLQVWVDQVRTYQDELALAKLQKKPPKIKPPGPRPSPAGAMCAPSTAFGIAAADIVPPAGAS
jgi:hypothetical protein